METTQTSTLDPDDDPITQQQIDAGWSRIDLL